MRQSLKIAISLLITLAVFSGFTLLAFSGLFSFIEANFYNPRIKAEYQQRADGLSAQVAEYHQTNLRRYGSQLEPAYVVRAFLTNQVPEDIRARTDAFALLRREYPDLKYVRFVGAEGRDLHFSTLASDLKQESAQSRVYLPFDQVSDVPTTRVALAEGGEPRVTMDSEGRQLIYSLLISDQFGSFRGTGLFYVAYRDLYNYLVRQPGSNFAEVSPIDDLGFLVGFPENQVELVRKEVAAVWSAGQEAAATPVSATSGGERYVLFWRVEPRLGAVGLLVPASQFEISPPLKVILLATVFLTVFLIVFLIFNLRQDTVTAARAKIKHFQIEFLREFVESEEEVDWDRWRGELKLKEPALKRRLLKGLGRVPSRDREQVDQLIDKSWEEMLGAIGAGAKTRERPSTDLGRIEELLNRVIEKGLTVSTYAAAGPTASPGATAQAAVAVAEAEPEAEAVEELAEAEAVEELAEAEAVEELVEAEPVEELVEAEAVEELAEAEAVEELGEAEAVEELAEAEAVEELAEAEAVEELAEAEPIDELAEAEPVEELAEAEPIDELAEAEPIDELAEAVVIEDELVIEVGAEESSGDDELSFAVETVAVAAEELEDVGEAEAVEELADSVEELADSVEELADSVEELEELEELEESPADDLPEAGAAAVAQTAVSRREIDSLERLLGIPRAGESGIEVDDRVASMEISPELETFDELEPPNELIEHVGSPVEERRAPREPEEDLEELEPVSRIEPLAALAVEELEYLSAVREEEAGLELEDGDGQGELVGVAAVESESVLDLVHERKLTVLSIEEILDAAVGTAESIVLEDGVYRIRDEVYQTGQPGRSSDLQSLAESVLGGSQGGGRSGTHAKPRFIVVSDSGVSYDSYLFQFPRPITDRVVFRSLISISQDISAVSVVLLVQRAGDRYTPELNVGVDDETVERFVFGRGEDLYDDILAHRSALLVNASFREIPMLGRKVSEEDLGYMKRAFFMPAIYGGRQAYLFFAFAKERELKPRDLLDRLHAVRAES